MEGEWVRLTRRLVLVAVVVSLTCAACGGTSDNPPESSSTSTTVVPPESPILGEWSGEGWEFTFGNDQTFTASGPTGSAEGTWTLGSSWLILTTETYTSTDSESSDCTGSDTFNYSLPEADTIEIAFVEGPCAESWPSEIQLVGE
jgi:hypothetical protein